MVMMLRGWEGHKHRAVRKNFFAVFVALFAPKPDLYMRPPPKKEGDTHTLYTPTGEADTFTSASPVPRKRSPIIDNHLHHLRHTPSHPPAALQRPHNQALHRVQHRPRNHLPSRKMLPRRRLRTRGKPHREAHPHPRRTQPRTSTKAYPTITKQTPTNTCGGSPFKTTQSYHIEPISYEFNMI